MACSFIGLPSLSVGMPYLGRLVEKEEKKIMDSKELFCCPSGKSSLLELVWDGAPDSLGITCVKHEKGFM